MTGRRLRPPPRSPDQRVRRNHPFGTILKIALPALSMLSAAMAHGQTITNTAKASWTESGTPIQSSSNTVSFTLAQKTVSLKTFVVGAGGNNSVSFTPSQCGGAVLQIPGGGGGSSTAAVTPSNQIHPGELLYFSLDAALANTDPTRIDSVEATITTSSGDREVIKVYETGANTGVFSGAVPTSAIPPAPVRADCRLSIAGNDIIAISMTATGGTVPVANAQVEVLADPYGRLFNALPGLAFERHPYRRPVIGSEADLNAATLDDVRRFHATYYRPDNAVLIVTGAMAARDLSPRLASAAALVISLLIAFLTWFYYHLNVSPPVVAGYGLYVGTACALAALACSVWALAAALLGARTAR